MFLFKKKEEKKPEIQEFNPDDPRITVLPKISSQTLINSPSFAKSIPKLILWLNNHSSTIEVISFRALDSRMFPNDMILKQNLIKSQMYKCVKLVMKLEKAIRDGPIKPSSDIKHPCAELGNLKNVRELWRKVLVIDSLILECKEEINNYCWETTKEIKNTVAYCSSLIASQDTIPGNYIPIIDFSKLDMSNDLIASLDPNCFKIVSNMSLLEMKQGQYISQLNDIKQQYLEHEMSMDIFLAQILSKPYDERVLLFDDFIHYCANTVRCVMDYYMKPSLANYNKLVSGIIERYSVSPSSWNAIRDLCFEIVAQESIPKIAFNGHGCESTEIEILGIQVACLLNPLDLIRLLGSEENGSLALEGIKAITSMWKEIYAYAVSFTDPDTLSEKDLKLRNAAIMYSE